MFRLFLQEFLKKRKNSISRFVLANHSEIIIYLRKSFRWNLEMYVGHVDTRESQICLGGFSGKTVMFSVTCLWHLQMIIREIALLPPPPPMHKLSYLLIHRHSLSHTFPLFFYLFFNNHPFFRIIANLLLEWAGPQQLPIRKFRAGQPIVLSVTVIR